MNTSTPRTAAARTRTAMIAWTAGAALLVGSCIDIPSYEDFVWECGLKGAGRPNPCPILDVDSSPQGDLMDVAELHDGGLASPDADAVEAGCVPDCQSKECGDDGCGQSCGTCSVAVPYCVEGTCSVTPCPNGCEGQQCGCAPGALCEGGACNPCPSGCEGVQCGCEAGQVCAAELCCAPDCAGKECGSDGCGGLCCFGGACQESVTCADGVCDNCPAAAPYCAAGFCSKCLPPVEVGSIEMPSTADSVAVWGTHALVGQNNDGVRIFEVSDPTALAEVAHVPGSAYVYGVAVSNGLAYIGESTLGVRILDVSDPSAPVELGTVKPPGVIEDVAVAGTLVYVASEPGGGLSVVNAADPADPQLVTSHDTPGSAHSVTVSGDRVYLTDCAHCYGVPPEDCEEPAGLRIFDVSNPLAPVMVGVADTPWDAMDVAVDGDHAFVTSRTCDPECVGRLNIYDVSSPSAPTDVGSIELDGSAYGVAVLDNVVYIAASNSGLRLVDVTNPGNPVLAGGWKQTSPSGYHLVVDVFVRALPDPPMTQVFVLQSRALRVLVATCEN